MTLRTWRIQLIAIVALFGLMLTLLIINGILLLQSGHVWLAIGQSVAILVLVGVSFFLYHHVWLDIQRRRVLKEIGDMLTVHGGLNEFLERIVQASMQMLLLSDRCAIHLLDESGQALHLVSSAPDLEGPLSLPANRGLAGDILRELAPRLIHDTRQVLGPLPIDPAPGHGCLLVVPLYAQNKPLGILSLYSHIPGVFAPHDRLLLSLLATLASSALDRAHLESLALGEAGVMNRIVGDLADGVIILDQDDRLVYYNASLAPLLGANIREALGQRVHEESENMAARRLAALLACAPSKAEGRREFQAVLDDPFHCCFQVFVTPVLDQQKRRRQLIVLHDQTTESDKVRAQDDLMAVTLQESGPPLQSIRGCATLLQSEEIAAPAMSWARLMRDHSVRLMRLVYGLQDVLAMQEKAPSLNQEVTPLWPLVRDVLNELAEPAKRAGVTFDLHFPADLTNILCDPDRLRYILFFVLDNALHRGIAGGHVHLDIRMHCAHILFTITDDGHAIPAGTWERIQRGLIPSRDSSGEDPYDTGLGLYLGHRLVEAHGGHLWMEPPAERGAELYFILPYQPVAGSDCS